MAGHNQYAMDIEMILGFIGTLITGGVVGRAWTTWRNRKTDSRKEEAAADAAEIVNLTNVINHLTIQLEKAEERVRVRDTKVDYVYNELRNEQAEKLEILKQKFEIEIRLKDMELRRCDIPGCANRKPPSDF